MALSTAISLFTGYDGIGLGLKRVVPQLRTLCYIEREAYAVANLVSKIRQGLLDDAPIWSDIATFDLKPWVGKVDLIHGGYPCQGFSTAGKQAGIKDPRFLWPWCLRAVAIIQPRYCFFENVSGHLSNGLSTVVSDLEEAGYRVEAGLFSAAECGAPQRRQRVFILGERGDLADARRAQRRPQAGPRDSSQQGDKAGRNQGAGRTGEYGSPVADASLGPIGSGPERSRRTQGTDSGGGSKRTELDDTNSRLTCREKSARADGIGSTGAGQGVGHTQSDHEQRSAEPAMHREWEQAGGSGWVGQADPKSVGEREPHDQERPIPRSDTRQDAGGGSVCVGQANPECKRREGLREQRELQQGSSQEQTDRRSDDSEVAHSECSAGKLDRPDEGDGREPQPTALFWPGFVAAPGQPQHAWEPPRVIKTERGLGGGIDGRAANVDRLRLLGNGVYPATAAKAFVTLYNRLNENTPSH